MPLGGFAPLPLRLGGTPTEGVSASQHAQIAATLAALLRTTPFAVLTYVKSGATVTVLSYRGRNGNGVSAAPTPTVLGTGDVLWTWPQFFLDDFGTRRPIAITMARVSLAAVAAGVGAHIVSFGGDAVRAKTSSVDTTATLTVWESPLRVAIGDYDGAADKIDSESEGSVPYAASWYAEFSEMLGSSFTRATAGIVHARKLALARGMTVTTRAAEKLAANSLPATADESLPQWAQCLGVPFDATTPQWKLRKDCASKFRGLTGISRSKLEAMVADLLGDAFVAVHRVQGADLATPPTQTFWRGGTAGPASYDINPATTPAGTTSDETWLSERCHLVVEVKRPPHMSDADYVRLVNVDLFRLLDVSLPSWATFNAVAYPFDGFHVGLDQLDFTGL